MILYICHYLFFMIKSFFKDGGIYSLSGIITKGIGIILIPFYTNVFSTLDYGTLDLITVFGAIINITFPLQITHGVARHISDGKDGAMNKVEFSSTGLLFTTISYSSFLILSILFSEEVLNSFLFKDTFINENIYNWACISIAVNGIFYFFLHQLKWIRKVKTNSILSISHSILTISLTIYFVLLSNTGLVGVFMASVISTPIFVLLAYLASRECYSFKTSTKSLVAMLKYSFPIVFQALSLLILTFADRVIIKEIIGVSDTGIYGIAFKIASVMHILFTGFSYALGPLIYGNYHKKESSAEIAKLFEYFIILSFSISLIISLFSLELLTIFTQEDYLSAYMIVPILILVTLANGFQMFFHGLSIAKKTFILAIINIISATINICLNYTMIPTWGVFGAATATLISTIVNLFLLSYLSQKQYYLPLNFRMIVIPSIVICVILGIFLYFQAEITIYSILTKSIVIIAFIVFLIKLIDKDNLIISKLKAKK